jgi:hypothetical protein
MAESDDLVVHQVAADQPVGEPLLEGLVDQASGPGEVLLAAVEEVPQAELLGLCLLLLHGVPHPDQGIGTWFACAGAGSAFQTPFPPLPRACFRTRTVSLARARGNRARKSAASRYRPVPVPQPTSRVR